MKAREKWPGGTGVPGPCENGSFFTEREILQAHVTGFLGEGRSSSCLCDQEARRRTGLVRDAKKVVRIEQTNREPSHAPCSGVSELGVNAVGESR